MQGNYARKSCRGITLCKSCHGITPWNLFPLSKKSPQHSLVSAGYCFSFAFAIALVLFKYNVLSTSVKKKMRHAQTFFTSPRLPPFQTIALNTPSAPGDAFTRARSFDHVKHSFQSNIRFMRCGHVHLCAVHPFAAHMRAVHLTMSNGRLRCSFEWCSGE
jgi:hypothetical protein